MASMAVSTVAWAGIMMICGRSPSGAEANKSRMSSSPVRSGIRLSTTKRSKVRRDSKRWASRALEVATTSCPSSRRARPRALRSRSSSSTRRMLPWGSISGGPGAGRGDGGGRRRGQLDPDLRPFGGPILGGERAPQGVDDVRGDGEAEPGPRALGREVRLEDVGQVGGVDARSAVPHDEGGAAGGEGHGLEVDGGGGVARGRGQGPPGPHRLPGVGEDVGEGGAQPLSVRDHAGQTGVEGEVHGGGRVPGEGGNGGLAGQSVEVGGGVLQPPERKSVVEGKSVELGGRRII